MAKTPDDLSTEIADLKKALFDETKQEVKYTVENKDDATKEDKPFVETTAAVASALKKHLIDVVPKVTTESFFLPIVQQIKEIHTEVTKSKPVELLEATPFLGGIAAAWEKWYESKEAGADVKWQHWLLAALGGMALVTLLPAIRGLIVNAWRGAQARGDDTRRVWTKNADGGWGRETLGAVKQREQRVWNGGTSLADLVSDPANAQRAEALRQKLDPLNTSVEKFNRLAPDFLQSFGKLPREGKAAKLAKAVKTISDAIGLVNLTTLKNVAEGIEKLNKAVLDYKPTKIPKPVELEGVATKMGELATKTETLRAKFEGLQTTVRTLDSVIAGSTG
ncbi:reductive dehalogenase anchoring protein [Streptomyces venezuelae]|uniref:hypothetical protein n=1 Tax=Streptomyces gardneri TaxID=66892 RepID=UPI0006BD24A8|nr:hypothetical protein [Streptomyces gardneri]ALO10394.1 reductive dehalogenase anchoring protein [Streptomyces venezuelae]QPK47403.1 hypothetical protein H4W23_24095 [Streptomyces gardneri]WRK38832.1 hypothetical protein U0M97_24195 [Streptomyces venezuelae]CUM39143.1 hypothetical protein BN2537_7251 [Streptomyces venezuelae]